MRSRRAWLLAACAGAAVAAAGAALWTWHGPRAGVSRIGAAVSATQVLAGEGLAGYARAEAPRPFAFPRDHGPHPGFRSEWWYYTGNLRTADGRPLGFQLTFFRQALGPAGTTRDSGWRASEAYVAHFAVTDVNGRRFHASGRSSRAALGLAGARGEPFRVWLEDWSAEAEGGAALAMRLRAAEAQVAIDLVLDSAKPVVLQGERGLSRKGPEPGNASYYYSLTRMPARGTVRLGADTLPVDGLAWMDREWSTSALGKGLAGWDWFALQLDDGRDLMFYRLRRKDGSADPFSAGTLVDSQGGARSLGAADVRVEVLSTWRSPRSGVTYPARWRLTVAALDVAVELTPRLADQEILVGPRYWEGAVEVRGVGRARPLAGHGYVELVGYGDDQAMGSDGALGSTGRP